jgi:hypothetical protein
MIFGTAFFMVWFDDTKTAHTTRSMITIQFTSVSFDIFYSGDSVGLSWALKPGIPRAVRIYDHRTKLVNIVCGFWLGSNREVERRDLRERVIICDRPLFFLFSSYCIRPLCGHGIYT